MGMAEADRNKMRPQIAVMMVMVAVHVVGGVCGAWWRVAFYFYCSIFLFYLSLLKIFTFSLFCFLFSLFPFLIFRLRAPSDASWLTRAHRVASVASGPAPCAGLK